MSEITDKTIEELRKQAEQAKVIYLKYQGALEVMESLLKEAKEKKTAKSKK